MFMLYCPLNYTFEFAVLAWTQHKTQTKTWSRVGGGE